MKADNVAPLAGAWIEILLRYSKACSRSVAPLAGAWIEILKVQVFSERSASLPSRGRGLKYRICGNTAVLFLVAPLAGAWIEIMIPETDSPIKLSLSSRGRGLKSPLRPGHTVLRRSLSSRGRGLK